VPNYNPLILAADPKESYAYWDKYNKEYSCANTLGYPMYPTQPMFWKFQQKIAQCDNTPPYRIDTNLAIPNDVQYALLSKNSTPWIDGIQKNIDVESKLFQLGYYNNLECYPNNLICNSPTKCNNVSPTGPAMLSNSPQWNQSPNDMIYQIPPDSTYQRFNNLTKIKSLYARG
jgi:hypothetical protein